jgi:uncharacterized protein YyaL (SSP411 family)
MTLVSMFETDVPDLIDDALARLMRLHRTHFDGSWWRTESRRARATASDLGWLVEAHVSAFEATGDDGALSLVDGVVDHLLEHHWDGEVPTRAARHRGRGLFTSSDLADALALRAKDVIDDATPSSHAVAATALARLSMLRGDDDAASVAERLVEIAGELLDRQPTLVADLVRAYISVDDGREVVVPGPRGPLVDYVRRHFVPASVLVTGSGASPLLEGREPGRAYVCRKRVCAAPVDDVSALAAALSVVS